MLRNYFSNNFNASGLKHINNTPYKVKSKSDKDCLVRLINDMDQSITTLWLNCIQVLIEAPNVTVKHE